MRTTASPRRRNSRPSIARAAPNAQSKKWKKLAPAAFEYIDQVLIREEREAIVKGYAGMAGFALAQVKK